MGFFDKIKNVFVEDATTTASTSEVITLDQLIDFLNLGGVDKDALSEATYFACMKVLSESVGKLPLKLQQYTDKNGVEQSRKHKLYHIVGTRPNPYMTATIFWSTIEFNRNHHGNAYALIDGAGSKTQLWILPSENVEIWHDDKNILGKNYGVYYIYTQGTKKYKFTSEQILHFKTSNSLDGITGISVRDQLAMTIKGNSKAQELVNQMYDNGFTAKAVLQYTGSLSDDLTKKFVKGIDDYSTGKLKGEGIQNIIPVPLGSTLTPLNIKLGDNQFIEIKMYTALQIASAFGIKPYQIGDYTKSSYASAEAQQLSFYIDTLLYSIKQYEEELTFKLLSDDEVKKGYHFKFNIAVILRADHKTQIDTLAKAVNSFIYTPNECRNLLDMEDKDGGDQLLGNGASIPIQYAGMQYYDFLNNGTTDDTEDENQEET